MAATGYRTHEELCEAIRADNWVVGGFVDEDGGEWYAEGEGIGRRAESGDGSNSACTRDPPLLVCEARPEVQVLWR